MDSVDLLLRLFLAHIVSDFFIQTNKAVEKKKTRNIGIHILHSLTQAVVCYIAAWNFNYWEILPFIFISHIVIDYIKVTKGNTAVNFLADQILHSILIVILWLYLTNQIDKIDLLSNYFNNSQFLFILIGYLLMLKPSGVLISLFTTKWRDGTNLDTRGLQNAGMWIGYIERGLILTFVLVGSYESIGFLLAAKSIFRFGELNNAKDIKTTEYVLIGTFISFFIAIITGILINYLTK